MTHYQMTYEERRAISYIDRNDFNAHPDMLCRTGDGHAQGTRDKPTVKCPACLERLNRP